MRYLVYALRILIYGNCAYLALAIILAQNDNLLGWLLATPLAALAISLDLVLSAFVYKRPLSSIAAERIEFFDRLLSSKEEQQIEVYESEVLLGSEEERKALTHSSMDR